MVIHLFIKLLVLISIVGQGLHVVRAVPHKKILDIANEVATFCILEIDHDMKGLNLYNHALEKAIMKEAKAGAICTCGNPRLVPPSYACVATS
jgi:hypothetical protein